MNVFRLAVIVSICLMFTSCSNSQKYDCSLDIPTPNANDLLDEQIFTIETTLEDEVYYVGDPIPLTIVNTSDHQIWFPPDLNLFMIKRFDDPGFEILRNIDGAISEQPIVISESGVINNSYSFFVTPDLLDLGSSSNVEILVSGYITIDGEICKGRYYAKIQVDVLSNQ